MWTPWSPTGRFLSSSLMETLLPPVEGGGASVLAGAGLEGNDDLVLRFGEGRNGEEAEGECGERVAHVLSPRNVF